MVDQMLSAVNLASGYGRKQVLNSVSFVIRPSEIMLIVGPNGSGKSTLLRTLFGLLSLWEGSLFLEGVELKNISPRSLIARGVTYMPQGNPVFPTLSVRENLEVEACHAAVARALDIFPEIGSWLDRRAGSLSGGQRQLVALARVFSRSPRLLLLDEPSLGIGSRQLPDVFFRIKELCRSTDRSALIVEQKVKNGMEIADRLLVLKQGAVAFLGLSSDVSEETLKQLYF